VAVLPLIAQLFSQHHISPFFFNICVLCCCSGFASTLFAGPFLLSSFCCFGDGEGARRHLYSFFSRTHFTPTLKNGE
jgi:hypothetical protein